MASLSLNSGKTCPGERRPLLLPSAALVGEAHSLTCPNPSALTPPELHPSSWHLPPRTDRRGPEPRGSRHGDPTLGKGALGHSSAGPPPSWAGSPQAALSWGPHTEPGIAPTSSRPHRHSPVHLAPGPAPQPSMIPRALKSWSS